MPPYVPPLDEVEADLVATHLRPVLTSMFAPATDAGDADEMYTTTELHLLIEDHAPGMIQVEHMRTALARLGYREVRIGTDMRWMLKRA